MDDGGAAGQDDPTTSALGPWPLLAVWEVQADQGTGPVLLLARAAHCLQRLHVLEAARQPVAGSTEWQVCQGASCTGGCTLLAGPVAALALTPSLPAAPAT
jgi:hypothetical protein